MNNHERAEKILWHYPNGIPIEYLTSQLDEAVKEAEVVKVVSLAMRDIQNFEDGYSAAREQAAGIAKVSYKNIPYGECHITAEYISERIKAMKPPSGEGK